MDTSKESTNLAKMGVAIEASLSSWEEYLNTIQNQPTYQAIISEGVQNEATKAKALLHLLEALPIRHAALVISYSDFNINFVQLTNPCANLLGELERPGSNVELESCYNRNLTSKKCMERITQFEDDIRMLEQGRLQELRRLKAVHMGLTDLEREGELGAKELGKLWDAMEELGVCLVVPGAFEYMADEHDEHG